MDLKALLKFMVDKEGSDLYLSTGTPPSMKVDGKLARIGKTAVRPADTENIAHTILSERQQAEFERDLELNLALSYEGLGRFRVNIFRQRGTVGLVIRRIYDQIPSFEELNLPDQVREIIEAQRGMVLVVGATGSGKSTSLAAMIDHRNRTHADHIITVEDPIEYVHSHKKSLVNQRELSMDTHSWESALENTLRQAPDVILIGEIRNAEVMEHVIAFADTGHLAISTLHANNANQAMERIVNFFNEDRHNQTLMDLSLNLKAVVSQRLVPRADGRGRVAAVEILLNTGTVADLIAQGKFGEIKQVMESSRDLGMQTFDQALLDLYNRGEITAEEAQSHADSVNDVRLAVKMAKIENGESVAEESEYQIDDGSAGGDRGGRRL
ncbi:PilT/PilU family type 4a pilus ATPase [Thiohalorhabdus denitrificans]|uniref:Twitching motility protein PilU n=1 Tax=Thiohalorhabdus denitrificans TaxID=381306 RepID=A0A1G5FR73_9GAMM|nr:PilT/PilU family type 4a pilus ATPase [Thiohalorhabdus denitrificans]SCY41805.1 twitching motility protein PilU [Thiohalorhabdus denitrificans]